jgi:hypothetical protein
VEARCQMLAMKEWRQDSGQVRYSRCCVLDAPAEIPDGKYTVFFDRHRVPAIRQGGLWLPEDRAEPLPPRERLESRLEHAFRMEDAIEILPLLKNDAA